VRRGFALALLSTFVVAGSIFVMPGRSAAQAAIAPSLPRVLARAADWVEEFADRMSGVVVEETYVQQVHQPINRFGSQPANLPRRAYSGPIHRELKSDLLLVRPVGADGWMQFRDVTEVDGRALKDRNDRLARLFLEPSKSTATQAQKIMSESARYNIGDIERNINLPVLALIVLNRYLQPGFQFQFEKDPEQLMLPRLPSFVVPGDAVIVSFTETQMRTLVASPQGRNLPASGHFWLDPKTSRVLISEIGIEDLWLKATIFVAYGNAEPIDVPMPVVMHERYENKLNGTSVDGTATYSNFREFKVNVDENIAPIKSDR
jgi:hypothetical protein